MDEYKLTIRKMYGHLKTIIKHRYYVRHYCFLAGIYWRGITHDLSKYSPVEFFESARYWNGHSSPINLAKKHQGISYAWLHHKGRNKHHYEYYFDNFDNGGIARLMPCKDFVESVCDMLGASLAYSDGNKTNVFRACKKYWNDHQMRGCAMNEKNQAMMDRIWWDLSNIEAEFERGDTEETPENHLKHGYLQRIWRMFADE